MKVLVKMPKFGLQMTEGYITEWKVAPGDTVKKGMPLFIVETDKLVNNVESPCDGSIKKLLAEAGEVVPVGSFCCEIEG